MAWCYVGFIWLFEAITCLFYFIWVKTKRKITKYWLEIIQSLKRELPASAHSFIEGSSLPSFICCHSAPLPPSFKVPSRSSIGSCCLSYLRGVVTPKFDVVSSFVSQSTFCSRRLRRGGGGVFTEIWKLANKNPPRVVRALNAPMDFIARGARNFELTIWSSIPRPKTSTSSISYVVHSLIKV